jgi:hypothetical protein
MHDGGQLLLSERQRELFGGNVPDDLMPEARERLRIDSLSEKEKGRPLEEIAELTDLSLEQIERL